MLFVDELKTFIINIQKQKASDPINYAYFKSLLLRLYRSEVYPEDFKYDWVVLF